MFKLNDKDALMTNINAVLDTQLNGECSGSSQGQFQLRQTATVIASLIQIKEFVEKNFSDNKNPSVKKEGK
jgi:hypothetical protein